MSKLANKRKAAGLSQSQLAQKSGVSVRMIQYYEQNVRDINLATAISLYHLACALECSIEDILEPNTIIYDKKRFGYLSQYEVKFSDMWHDIKETNEIKDVEILETSLIFTEYVYNKENEIRYCYEVIHRNRDEWMSEMYFTKERLEKDYFIEMYNKSYDEL